MSGGSRQRAIDALKARLGPLGAFGVLLAETPIATVLETARAIEQAGYGALWCPEAPMIRESLVQAALLLGATSRITVATGITSIYTRDPTAAWTGAAALEQAHPGRFLLGLGVSHAPSVEFRGHRYAKPLPALRSYLDGMDAARTPGLPEPSVVLGALRPRMLALAAERTSGAVPFLTTVDHTARARRTLGPGPLLAPVVAVALDEDRSRARVAAREHVADYLGLPNYVANLRSLGYAPDELDPSDPADRLVDDLVAWGTEADAHRRVADHRAAGADHVVLNPVGTDVLGTLRRLTPAHA